MRGAEAPPPPNVHIEPSGPATPRGGWLVFNDVRDGEDLLTITSTGRDIRSDPDLARIGPRREDLRIDDSDDVRPHRDGAVVARLIGPSEVDRVKRGRVGDH